MKKSRLETERASGARRDPIRLYTPASAPRSRALRTGSRATTPWPVGAGLLCLGFGPAHVVLFLVSWAFNTRAYFYFVEHSFYGFNNPDQAHM